MKEASPEGYTAYDFDPSRYRHMYEVKPIDLSGLEIAEESVDLLVCNHVLEHVPDMPLALREIHRVLKPGGVAILQVPLALNLQETIELSLESTEQERIERVGQRDHLRLLTPDDYFSYLTAAKFAVERFDAFAEDAKTAMDWQLDPFEKLYICRKDA